jgi:uncharacterized protein YegP (UPF0339 family)
MEIVIKKGGVLWWKKYHFTIKAENNEILCRSRKFNTVDEIFYWLDKIKRSMQSGLGLSIDVMRDTDQDQPYHFRMVNVYSEDNEIILWSENYHNRKDCKYSADLIKKEINNAKITIP